MLLFFFIMFLSRYILVESQQIYESRITLSNKGTTFIPKSSMEYSLQNTSVSSKFRCATYCNQNIFCRTFIYDEMNWNCELYPSDLTTGNITLSTISSTSLVGMILYEPSLFVNYNKTCKFCQSNRYLTCQNSICQCPSPYTFWNGSLCQNKFYYGETCTSSLQCRQDLNLSCICGSCQWNTATNPPLQGTTIFGDANGSAGSSLMMLNAPWCITVNSDNSMLITDSNNIRVLLVFPNMSTGVVVGPPLKSRKAVYDSNFSYLFVIDNDNCIMMKYPNSSLPGTQIFGGSCGSNLNSFDISASFYRDSTGNFYIVDNYNHRIMFWAANATSGVVVAGETNVPGNDILHLQHPQDVTLNETQGLIYVADTYNHRIMRYSINSSVGSVVAGGNGPGVQRNQLNGPCGVYVSKKSDALYIADTSNHRIVRWNIGDSVGTTIAGSCNGTAGTSAFLLNTPTTVTMDREEKYLYVNDRYNNRIQIFPIV